MTMTMTIGQRLDNGDYEISLSGCTFVLRLYNQEDENTLSVQIGNHNSVIFNIENEGENKFSLKTKGRYSPDILLLALSFINLYQFYINKFLEYESNKMINSRRAEKFLQKVIDTID